MSASLLHKNKLTSVAVLVLIIALLTIVFFSNESDTTLQLDISGSIPSTADSKTDNNVNEDEDEKTIATAWHWEASTTDSNAASSGYFSEEAVYSALQRVRLDSEDNVIIDNETLIALNETLDDSRLQLDSQTLTELQMIIRQGLPGNTGDEVAKIVGDYYQLLGASKEFNNVYESAVTLADGIENTNEQHKENYRELMTLRELYMGADVAEKLFSTSDANAEYMFDMFRIEQDSILTEEEKKIKRAEITNRHTEQTIKVDNWNIRQQAFLAAKKNILMASISEEQKQAQLTELMHQHFNPKELTHLGHLQLDKP